MVNLAGKPHFKKVRMGVMGRSSSRVGKEMCGNRWSQVCRSQVAGQNLKRL